MSDAKALYVYSNGRWIGSGAGGSPSSITIHDGPIPQPTFPTPSGVEDAYKGLADGLHYYKDAATVISVVRQEYQTTVVVQGPIRSVARIVKSSTGQPTTQNPSTLVTCDSDGKWMRFTSAELDKPFDNPQMVDLFALTGGGGVVDLSDYCDRAESDERYARKQDNEQALLAKTATVQAIGFGDSLLPPVALTYTDTGEGYGPRLVFTQGLVNDYLVLKSDLDPLNALLPRVESLESKAAPAVDLSPYVTIVDADVQYARKEAVTLLQAQAQAIFDSIYTRAESDGRYYTQKQTDDRFMRIDQAFSKADFDNQMALFLYSRKQVDDRLAAINPLGSPSINDPALATFKQSVLDEVKKMMSGGKTIPADVPWTNMVNAGSAASTPQAKVLNGVVYLRGEVVKSIGSGYIANAFQLPATIPPPPREMVIPLACKNTSPAGRYYGYATFQVNRQVGISCDNALNTVWLDGISYPAYE
jgi:hypothetical protein